MKTGIELIAKERARQVSKEGWTADHDDKHHLGELGAAAECYVTAATFRTSGLPMRIVKDTPPDWPWDYNWWKPSKQPIKNLIKAGALIAAEIDRLQRASATPKEKQSHE